MKKHVFVYGIKLCIVVGLFVMIFHPETFGFAGLFGDVAPLDVWNALREASTTGTAAFFFWMACATGVKLLGITSGIIRWRLLLAGQGIKIPFLYLTYQWFMGRAIGLVLPGTIGLDGFRLIESSRYTREVVKCTTVIAVEKLTGIIALSFLVFATFPLGFKYLQFNTILLVAIMAVLLAGVVSSLLLLLNPRVIQVLAAVMPVPAFARGLVNKLGRAATAYGNAKGTLIAALFFGLLVHLGTCSKYFFTFMAIRATNVSAADIFFVSPLMITAGILTFTISGLGVREIAFGLVLGGTAGHAVAILGGHLGLWAGEIIPFALSVPLLIFGGRPSRKTIEEDREYVEESLADTRSELKPLLSREETTRYRKEVASMLCCGVLMGLFAGALIAFLESFWIGWRLQELGEWGLLPWGVVAYSVIFAGVGLATSAGLLFLSLLFDRFPSWPVTAGLTYALTFASGAVIIGVFRFQRDILAGHAMTSRHYGMVACLACGAAVLLGVLVFLKSAVFRRYLRMNMPFFGAACLVGWAVLVGAAWGLALYLTPTRESNVFKRQVQATGPNIILCAIDALRADYLRVYTPDAATVTPNLDAFTKDALIFRQAFSQASWTKPSFATMFTGLYPEAHGATSKTAALSPTVETLAGLLQQGGYYAKGFSNNPNVTKTFGMDRGFTDYVDLKPNPLFYATASSENLSLYGLMRKVFMVVEGKVRGGKLRVTDFYQPAETVSATALEWLDSGDVPDNNPFYLYLHYMETHDPFMDHGNPGVGYARARMENPDPERWLEPMRNAYISEIEYLDQHLGALFEGLKARGLYDTTAIVFVADHGEEFFDHKGWWHGQTLYEELLRVPLLIKLPQSVQGGTANENMARLIDLAPTMLHLAGLPAGSAMSGRPLCDASGAFTNADIAYSYAHNDFEGNLQQGVRSRDRALIQANEDNPRGVAPVELYDMVTDPAQQRNLAKLPERQDELTKLKEIINDFIRLIHENAPEPGATVEIDPNLQQQLEALGYL